MELWTIWLDTLRGLLGVLGSNAGLGVGLAIIAATLLLRIAILPVSWYCGYRAAVRQKKLHRLQPELEQLRERVRGKPEVYAEQMMALYRKHDLTLVDGRSLLGAFAQMPIFLGMFQVLREGLDSARFLWIANLARPDATMALIAGATTALMIAFIPDLPEPMRMLMMIVPSIIVVLAAWKFASALSVYWAVSNCFSAAQTAAVHFVVRRRIRSGALKV